MSISLDEPVDPVLRCLDENAIARISFAIEIRPSSKHWMRAATRSGRWCVLLSRGPETLGGLEDFEMVPLVAN